MNFVIVAPGYYPLNDPESYCGTRFAASLALADHVVEVITYERPRDFSGFDYAVLTHPKVRVTRLARPCRQPTGWPHIDWKWLTVMEDDHDLIEPYVAATREALARYEKPILVTRTYPWLSLYVGWHCRKYAAKWIQHFSDPMIDFRPFCRLAYLKIWSLKWWMRRAMREADAISVTCKRVRWYYREQLGPCVDKAKFILTTHIGDFKLEGKGRNVDTEKKPDFRACAPRKVEECLSGADEAALETALVKLVEDKRKGIVYHDGDIYNGRGLLMVEAVDRLNAEGFPCLFLQGRDVKRDADRAKLLASENCRIVGKDAPPELKALAKSAQVSFVADFDTPGLPYSPFLMSKFVYQLFTDKPIVVLSKLESEKHDYCAAYPEAGLFFAEIGKVETLVAAVKAAFACDPQSIDRTRIRQAFSEASIGEHFVREISQQTGQGFKECGIMAS